MDLDAYVAEHAPTWRRLQQLTAKQRLDAAEADELITLYQRTGSHLSAIRSRAPDPALLAFLSRIVLTARSTITGGSAFSWRTIGRFFTTTFPLAVYQARWWWGTVGAAFVVGALSFMWYVDQHPEFARQYLSDYEIDQLVNHDFAAYYSENPAQDFGLQVWTNNALVSAMCLASGVLILPVLYMLYQNFFNIGLSGGVMLSAGRGDVFFGLIGPHGMLELTAVFVAAGVGLRMGWAWIAPGPLLTRSQSLARAGRSAMLVALGLVGVLAVSGFIEAYVTPAPIPTVARLTIGAIAWCAFLCYVIVCGGRAHRAGQSADLDPDLAGSIAPAA